MEKENKKSEDRPLIRYEKLSKEDLVDYCRVYWRRIHNDEMLFNDIYKDIENLKEENKYIRKQKGELRQRLLKLEEAQAKLIRVKENKELIKENKNLKEEIKELEETLEHRDSVLSIMYDLLRSDLSDYEQLCMIDVVIDVEVGNEPQNKLREELLDRFWKRDF